MPSGVVDESEEEVLADVAHHRAAEADGFLDAAQVAFEQRNAGAFHRHIGAGAHRDADIGRGERGRVVDTVPGHRDDVALLAQFANSFVFVLRLDAGFHLIDAELLRDGARGAFVVAGEHDDFDTELMQMRRWPRRSIP